MKITRSQSLALTSVLSTMMAACAADPPPVAANPAPTPLTAAVPTQTDPPAPVKAPEPTAEEKKKAEEARQLQEDRVKADTDHQADVARWTPAVHAEAKALVEKAYPNGKAAITAIAAGKHRRPENAARDAARHPVATLDFFGFKPSMTVIDIGPGEGWYTELLAPALAKKGKYIATGGDPNGPADSRGTFGAQRFASFLQVGPEAYGKIATLVVDSKAPNLGAENSADMVLLMRGAHGWKNSGNWDAWVTEVHRVLKPGGVLGLEEHRAAAGANADETSKKGYLPEQWVIEHLESAGFKLAGKSEVNANPKDTKDYSEGVWALPPTYRLKDQDRDKYTAIGESDRMTLKFVKVADKKVVEKKPATDKAAPKKP